DTSENNLSSAEKRRLQKEKESGERRLKRMKEQLEKEIGILEEDINGLEIAVCLKENMTDHKKLAEISEALNEKRQQLDEKYEKWLELQE
ncbi:MAG: ABC transporter C-terminal domain-containing protein, partial [Anaerovoracaceae bacterium]